MEINGVEVKNSGSRHTWLARTTTGNRLGLFIGRAAMFSAMRDVVPIGQSFVAIRANLVREYRRNERGFVRIDAPPSYYRAYQVERQKDHSTGKWYDL